MCTGSVASLPFFPSWFPGLCLAMLPQEWVTAENMLLRRRRQASRRRRRVLPQPWVKAAALPLNGAAWIYMGESVLIGPPECTGLVSKAEMAIARSGLFALR